MKSKLVILMAILTVALWVAPASALTTGVFTGTGAFDNLPVSASAKFITSTDTIEVEVWNNQANPTSIIQCLSALSFVLSTGQTTGSIISFSATARQIDRKTKTFSDKIFTDAAAESSTWHLDNNFSAGDFGNGLKLNDLGSGNQKNTIIGPADPTKPTQYTDANASITGKTHSPEWFGTADTPVKFLLQVNGVTDLTTVTFVEFSFGTAAGNNVDVLPPAVPIPASALLLGSGLLGLGLLGWRRKKSR